MRLYPVEEDDPIGLDGIAVEMNRQAEGVGSEHDRFHVGSDRALNRVLGDAQLAQEAPLPDGSAAAMASHRGHNERVEPERADRLGGRTDDPGDIGDAAAADSNRDPTTGLQPPSDTAAVNGRDSRGGNVGELRLVIRSPYACNGRKSHDKCCNIQ